MVEKSVASGVVPPYGVAIGDAVSKSGTTLAQLVALRNHARDIVGAQGDLIAALKALDAEIASRGRSDEAAPRAEARFVAQIEGLTISAVTKREIEQAIQKAVMAEIAKFDVRGDLVATSLSQAKDLSLLLSGESWPPMMGLILQG